MGKCATAGTCLASLEKLAVPLCQRAEHEYPRKGPGRNPEIPDCVLSEMVTLGLIAPARPAESTVAAVAAVPDK